MLETPTLTKEAIRQANDPSYLLFHRAGAFLMASNVTAPMCNREPGCMNEHFIKAAGTFMRLKSRHQGFNYAMAYDGDDRIALDHEGNSIGLNSGMSGEALSILISDGAISDAASHPTQDELFYDMATQKAIELNNKYHSIAVDLYAIIVVFAMVAKDDPHLCRRDAVLALRTIQKISMPIHILHEIQAKLTNFGLVKNGLVIPFLERGMNKRIDVLKTIVDNNPLLMTQLPTQIATLCGFDTKNLLPKDPNTNNK